MKTVVAFGAFCIQDGKSLFLGSDYVADRDTGVHAKILEVAKSQGYKGDNGYKRMLELGWHVQPLYAKVNV